MARVHFDSVSKVYEGGVEAVTDASFTVEDKEFVVLVGPSGCGKSTLLRMVAGLETITAGSISIGDRVVNDVAPRDRDVAMVFQNYALYPHMNVFENMAMGLRVRKTPAAEIRTRVTEAAEMLGIANLLERRPRALSGGQRQRVALGRAVVRRPQVFLFDEPLSNLDAKMRVETRTEIGRLHHELEATMIYVTHDQTEAMTMGDRLVVLEGGRIQQIGAPLELYDRPANSFVASFVGSPAMNFWPVRVDGGQLSIGSHSFEVRGNAAALASLGDRELLLGLRPEDIHLDDRSSPLHVAWPTELEVVEPLGSETLVYWRSEQARSVARVDSTAAVRAGETVTLHADLSRAHFFDPKSGESVLSWPGA